MIHNPLSSGSIGAMPLDRLRPIFNPHDSRANYNLNLRRLDSYHKRDNELPHEARTDPNAAKE